MTQIYTFLDCNPSFAQFRLFAVKVDDPFV